MKSAGSESASIISGTESLARRIRDYQREEEQRIRVEAVNKLAKQVAHDIRSPLSALQIGVSSLKGIPEQSRVLIRSALDRIQDIANDLLVTAEDTPISMQHLQNPSPDPSYPPALHCY